VLLTLPMVAAAQALPRTAERVPVRKQTKDDRTQPVTVDADKMERFGKEGLVVFTGNVVARQNNSVQYAGPHGGSTSTRAATVSCVPYPRAPSRISSRGTAAPHRRRAEYYDLEQPSSCCQRARCGEEDNVVSGETITISCRRTARWCMGGPPASA